LETSRTVQFTRFEKGRWQIVDGTVAEEELVRLHVNGLEWARIMCTPRELDQLALGFLRSEGFIQSMADVRLVNVCPSRTCVEVWLQDASFEPPRQGIITSGCGGGITFADLTAKAKPLDSDLRVTPGQISRLMHDLLAGQQQRGVHTAALAKGETLVVVTEDVGRHNTIDRLCGHCLVAGIDTRDGILVSTGRISSEMLNKAVRMKIPVVVSRTSPTSLSVALARAWHVTLVGYARRDSLNVYAGQERIVAEETSSEEPHNEEESTDANS